LRSHQACYKRAGDTEIGATVWPTDYQYRGTVLFLHGGALIWGARKDIEPWFIDVFNRRGLSVVSVDYRLAPATKLPLIAQDVRDALLWVRGEASESLTGGRGPIIAVGRSAGGYLALLSGLWPERPSLIVSLYGYGSVRESWYTESDPFYSRQGAVSQREAVNSLQSDAVVTEAGEGRFAFYLYTRQQGLWPQAVTGLAIGDLGEYCPVERLDRHYPATLLIHGTMDTDVPFESSQRMADRLRERGVASDLELLQGTGHAFDKDIAEKRVAVTYQKIVEFIEVHLPAQ
jgi:acetyl esterase/lipase